SRGKEHIQTDRISAGDIGAVSKLDSVETGDTLTSLSTNIRLDPIQFPDASYSVAVRPVTQSDTDKLSPAIQRMIDEDPSLLVERDPDTGDTIVSGMGEPHVQIAIERMKRRSNIDVELGL